MPRRYVNTHRFRDVLDALVTSKRFRGRNGGLLLPHRWRHCVGELIAQHARPLRLTKGVLTLAVESTAWMNELQYHVPEIIRRVNEELGDGKIQDVRMRVGQWQEHRPGEAQQVEPPPLAPQEKDRLARILDPVRDEKLKEQIARAWARNRMRRVDSA